MLTKKIFVDERNRASILCNHCGIERMTDVSRYANHPGPVRARCSCGHVFSFTLDKRKQYRKKVNLFGHYARMAPTKETGEILVENLSRTGLSFKTKIKTNMAINEIIKIELVLDDPQKSVIIRNAVVMRVGDVSISAEFCDNQSDKNLAFYLLP